MEEGSNSRFLLSLAIFFVSGTNLSKFQVCLFFAVFCTRMISFFMFIFVTLLQESNETNQNKNYLQYSLLLSEEACEIWWPFVI